MRAPAVAALSLTLISCTPSYPVPPGAQLACDQSDDCPSPLLCDLELGRCVDTIIKAPVLTLSVDRTEGTRNDVFTFTSASADAPLRYAWEVLDDASGAATVVVADGSATLLHRFALQRADFCRADAGCSSVLARTVRVTATNTGGKSSQRQVSVVVKNGPPVADFGDDLFVSEVGVPEIELDICGGVRLDGGCTTRDPDGDELSFTGFRQLDGPAVMLRDAGPTRVRFTPPQGWVRPLLFEGAVSDGVAQTTGRIAVYRGSHAWVGAGLADETYRIHPDFRAVTSWVADGGSQFYSPEALVADGVGGWWFGDSDPIRGVTLVVHLDSSLTEIERLEEPGNATTSFEAVPSLVPPRGSISGCLVFRHGNLNPDLQSGFVRFTTGQPLLAIKHSRPPSLDGGVRLPLAVLPVGATPDCWAIGQGPNGAASINAVGGELGKLRPDGTWLPVAMLAGFPGAWAAEADGTLWIAERFPDVALDGGVSPPVFNAFHTELRRFSPSGSSSTVEVGGRFLSQIAAHPAGGLWALDAHEGQLVRVRSDGTLVEATTTPIGAGNVFTFTGLAADPSGTAVWVTDALAARLFRFAEGADGGLTLAGVARVEDLPDGVNKQGFGGRIAIDPVTGGAATFVGAVSSLYARWVLLPPHMRRQERSGWEAVEPAAMRGDPSSGNLWLTNGAFVRRLDVSGRLLVEIPHVWADPRSPSRAPLVVDRSGRAWVATTDGIPSLRVIDRDGNESQRVPLPFVPASLELGSSMQPDGAHEIACVVSPSGGVARIDLRAPAAQVLTVPVDTDGGAIVPYACAPLSSGQLWVLANQYVSPAIRRPHYALRYAPASPAPATALEVLTPRPMDDGVLVTGAGADEATGELFLTTWHFPGYESELVRVSLDGGVGPVRTLQGGANMGIGLGVKPRRVCSQWVPSCVELWVHNRLSEVRRFDLNGNDVGDFQFERPGDPKFDLVP